MNSLVIDVGILGTLIIGIMNLNKIHILHIELNSRLSELIKSAKKESRARGVLHGRKIQKKADTKK